MKKPFETTAVIHRDGTLEVMGGALVQVKHEASKSPGARAVVLREVVKKKRKAKKKCKSCYRPASRPISAGGECPICGTEDAYR